MLKKNKLYLYSQLKLLLYFGALIGILREFQKRHGMQLWFVALEAGSRSQSQTDCCSMLYELAFKIMILL